MNVMLLLVSNAIAGGTSEKLFWAKSMNFWPILGFLLKENFLKN